ncbi:MAG: histidine phosphatase family protein [Rhodospirillaceae bacterium]
MKRLFILRHAKSGWSDPAMDDFDRPLAPRGRRAAPRIGGHMRSLEYRPSVALCSPAGRARETWRQVLAELDCVPLEDIRPALYHAEPRTLLDAVRSIDDIHPSAIVIGHNPGILTLALGLVGRGIASANPFGKYPTGALTVFDFAADSWADIGPGDGTLIDFTRPKDLDRNA